MIYYNENEPAAAAWLKQLITDGHLPYGDVDDRSIEDVKPNEIDGYTQCHFFAGIGGWTLVLELAGWPTDRPAWTGSCPCQPFSAAGARGGVDDPRHLWPVWRWLIDQCRPPTVFGEQVASKAGRQWLTGVQTDLQAMGYDTAGADLCAASVGAPHIRQRLWWVGHSEGDDQLRSSEPAMHGEGVTARGSSGNSRMGNTISEGPQEHWGSGQKHAAQGRKDADGYSAEAGMGSDSGVADTAGVRSEQRREAESPEVQGQRSERVGQHPGPKQAGELQGRFEGLRGSSVWRNATLIPCADGKQRRIEPGTQPLVDGIPRGVVPECDPGAPGYAQNTGEARRMRLYGYGNAIVPQVGAEFVAAFMECEE